ncbi:MAG: thioredoxin family protein [Chitinophagales bacterium]|nr:thioredoxin family protein [Chitinophagales bacterium]
MKQLFFTLISILILSTSVAQNFDASQFYTKGSYDEVHEIANQQNKKLMVVFGAKWCIPCKKLENEVFTNQEVNQYLHDNFVVLKADVDYFEFMDLAEEHNVTIYPTTMIFDSNDSILERFSGLLTVDELLSKLMIMNMNYEIEHPNDVAESTEDIDNNNQEQNIEQEEIIEHNSISSDDIKTDSKKKKCKKKK